VESDTGRELCRVQRRRVNGLWHTTLSDDGSTLVAVELVDGTTETHTLDIWDVHPHRAYAWSLAIVAALMVAMFTLSRSLRAWRNRSKPVRA